MVRTVTYSGYLLPLPPTQTDRYDQVGMKDPYARKLAISPCDSSLSEESRDGLLPQPSRHEPSEIEESSPASHRRPTGQFLVAEGAAEELNEKTEFALLEFPQAEPESQVYITREQRRSRRKRSVRARTVNIARFAKSAIELGRLLQPELSFERPVARQDCASLPRPCPFVSCRHHLYLDVSPRTGSIKLNFPDLEVWEMGHSCSLDLADEGPHGLEDVGAFMNLTRERIRQLEKQSLSDAFRQLETGGTAGDSRAG